MNIPPTDAERAAVWRDTAAAYLTAAREIRLLLNSALARGLCPLTRLFLRQQMSAAAWQWRDCLAEAAALSHA